MADNWFTGSNSKTSWFSGGGSSGSVRKSKSKQAEAMMKFQEEEALKKAAAEEEQRKQEESKVDKRSLLAKGFDTVNPLDSGKSWFTSGSNVSEEQQDKSAATQGKELVSGLFSGLEKTGDAIEALTGIAERRQNKWLEEVNAGRMSHQEYQKKLADEMKDKEWAGNQDTGTADRLKKAAGVSLEATSEIVPFMKGAKLAETTVKGGTALGAGLGLTHGTGGQLTNPDGFNVGNVALETAIGAAGGAFGGKLAEWNAGRKTAKEAAKLTNEINNTMDEAAAKAIGAMDAEDAFTRSQGITDPARMLPDGSASKAARLAEIDDALDEIRANPKTTPNTPETSTPTIKAYGKTIELTPQNGYNAVETPSGTIYNKTAKSGSARKGDVGFNTSWYDNKGNKLTQAQADAYISGELKLPQATTQATSRADEARALMRERQTLVKEIEAIKNPEVRVAEQINLVDADLKRAVQTGDTRVAKDLVKDQNFLDDQAVAVGNETRTRDAALDEMVAGGEMTGTTTKTSKLGARTELLGIKNEIGRLQAGELPEYKVANWQAQKQVVAQHIAENYDEAVQVALGKAEPRPGAHPEAYYVELGNRLAKDGDGETLHKLITQGELSKSASVMGQRISTLQNLDPDNPISVANRIVKEKGKWGKQYATISKNDTAEIVKLKSKIDEEYARLVAKNTPEARKAYGEAFVKLRNFEAEAIANGSPKLKESLKNAKFYTDLPGKVLGLSKGAVSTLDNSALGRQGWKMLWSNPKIWAKNSLKSFKDIAQSVGGKEVIDATHADIISRDNSLNGLYKMAGLDVFGAKKDFLEEAFPVSFKRFTDSKTGKVLMKPFKASEAAFTSFQQRNRADGFDAYLKLAEKRGLDVSGTTPESVRLIKSIGSMTNSLTSRGDLGRLERGADTWNKLFFSPRLLKSNIDVLGGHILTGGGAASDLGATGSNFVRKEAAKNLIKMAVGSYAALQATSAITGGKVEIDPRSSDFGKLKVGNTRFDMTGGMGGLLTLGARLATGQSKSSSDSEIKDLNSDSPFSQTRWDAIMTFAENKLSPVAGSVVDVLKGEDFDGNKPTAGSIFKNLTTPLIIQNTKDLGKPGSANPWAILIADGLGISANTYSLKGDWNRNNSKRVTEFKNKVSEGSFEKANTEFTTEFADWYNQVSGKDKFWSMPVKERESLVNSKKDELTNEVMARYGYKQDTTRKKKTDEEQALIDELKKLR